ncbi:MAG: signal recognition particle subunit SRP19/SEC65 family protein [Candidatus Thorarchaeota archaeon]
MRKESNKVRLFPEYFDKEVPRRNGRRLPKNLAIKDPTLLELKIAAQKMNLEVETREASHPSYHTDKRGMLLVTLPKDQEIKKTALIKRISQLTVSFSRPYIADKRQKAAEERKKKEMKRPKDPKDAGSKKRPSDKGKGPRPRRR